MSRPSLLAVNAAFDSRAGRRPDNQDYVGLCCDDALARDAHGLAFAVADGVSGGAGGRAAAELAARGFLDGYYASELTGGVARAGARVMSSLNAWLHSVGRSDAALAGCATTLTALVLQGRSAHVLHVGDTRCYLLRGDSLTRLTEDHVVAHPDLRHVLRRAVGLEPSLRLDHVVQPLEPHDRLLLCSDGIHGVLPDRTLRALLRRRRAPTEDVQALVEEALAAGSQDNLSGVVIDVLTLPEASAPELQGLYAALPLRPVPAPGEVVDGFRIVAPLGGGRSSRLLRAVDLGTGENVVLKFPLPATAGDAPAPLAFVREAWVSARVPGPWLVRTRELPPGRQTCLYTVTPFIEGETLEQRLQKRRLTLAEGAEIARPLARAVGSLHRAGVIHRDIKPENVLLGADGTLRLLDLGAVRLPRLEELPSHDIPGTPSYLAPELFEGDHAGDEATDLFALGVTLYRAFTGRYPYGEIEAFSRPRFGRPVPLSRHRPDLPAWLEALLASLVAVDRQARPADALDFALQLEDGLARGDQHSPRRRPLYERDPLRFWQVTSALLALALLVSLAWR